ncbi:RNA methyltransferase [Fulvitalea axinellae]|uniref:RNA methyltransferase n=1 Tax=Fulvitalea axinellae TaxID=1182444 RepID=A0AAU9CN00_9BACT|nr:RNA methyltransferase [Fulvitalea axinellae]
MRKLKNEELGRLSVEEFKEAEKAPIVIVLDNVRSLNNVGSAFRTGDAFLIEKLYLCGITGRPPHRDIQKTALGAQDSVTWEHAPDSIALAERLKEEGYTIVAVEQAENSVKLDRFEPEPGKKYALVFGNEVFGVDEKIVDTADIALEIPQFGSKHSLNISVSMGIVLWEVFKKIRL